MKNLNTLILIVLFLGTTFSCPENCQTCTADVTKCEVCSAGYELNEKTQLCDLSYTQQSEWGGVCTSGKKQSPINIETSNDKICPSGAQFKQITNTVENTINPAGQNLKASYVDQSIVSYMRNEVLNTYKSLQFHWHHPSEHQINGEYLDLELHIVHSNSDGSGNLAVTGLFFKVDEDMENDIFDQFNFIPDNQSHPFVFPINMKNRLVYHYEGSLTTPPCSEIVNWFVYTQYFPITKKNLQKIVQVINSGRSNSRAAQDLNDRQIQIFGSFCNSMFF